MNNENIPGNDAEREVRLSEARHNVQEVEGFLDAGTGIFEEELFLKLKSELEDAAEVFLEEELETERAYALGLYERLKKRNPEPKANRDDNMRRHIYHKTDIIESKKIGSAVTEIGAINEANHIVLGVENDMSLNEREFKQLSPTAEEIAEWRRKLETAIAIWNDPRATNLLKFLNDKFPGL